MKEYEVEAEDGSYSTWYDESAIRAIRRAEAAGIRVRYVRWIRDVSDEEAVRRSR